ncbi:MAG TPA: hypothetical protein VG603_02230 [Chitinophagales bacterium]|nr:hypothetical protein [Chitinophagales bacterium]
MKAKLMALLFMVLMAAGVISCNHNKIACPTYADSFPEAKTKKKSPDQPQIPKATKPKSGVLPPGYGKKK